MTADECLLEFIERVNRPDDFPDRQVARHALELFVSWLDLILVSVEIDSQPNLHNSTDQEYDAFIESCAIADSYNEQTLLSYLEEIRNKASNPEKRALALDFHHDIWRRAEKLDPVLAKGAKLRLCGGEETNPTRTIYLFLYNCQSYGHTLHIELYSTKSLLAEDQERVVTFCDGVMNFIAQEDIRLLVSTRRRPPQKFPQDSWLAMPQFPDEPKVLFKYVEASVWFVMELIRQEIEVKTGKKIEDFSKETADHKAFLPEFVFTINVARRMNNSIPDDIGYHLTASQIKAVRNYVAACKIDITHRLEEWKWRQDGSELATLKLDPDVWIDEMQNEVFASTGYAQSHSEEGHGLSGYVLNVKEPELVVDVESDHRLTSKFGYPIVLQFIEEEIVQGKYLLMVPIFLRGNIVALFWMNSNIRISGEIRFILISLVRRYENLIANAILMEWEVVKPLVSDQSEKAAEHAAIELFRALEDLASHALQDIKSNLPLISQPAVDFVIEVIRYVTSGEMNRTFPVNLLSEIEGLLGRSDIRQVATIHLDINADAIIYTNKALFMEAFRLLFSNAVKAIMDAKHSVTKGTIKISASYILAEESYLVELWDSGDPFPISVRGRVFDNRQVGSSHGGRGLGCGNARLIISKLGGHVWLDQTDWKTIKLKIPKHTVRG